MATEIIMPKVAMGQTEGKVTEWLVEEGTKVDKDQMIMVIETEKVAYEIESPASGIIHQIAETENVMPCGEIIAYVAKDKKEYEEISKDKTTTSEKTEQTINVVDENKENNIKKETLSDKIFITPVAKILAKENNIDISKISGTGPSNRIQKRDVDAYLENTTKKSLSNQNLRELNGRKIKQSIPFKGMRKSIADNVVKSLNNTAQLSWAANLDFTNLLTLRKKLNKKLEKQQIKITVNDLFVFFMSKAIKNVPAVNSSIVNNEIIYWDDINIGVATAIETENTSGLVVPVIKNADRKSLIEISKEAKELSKKARENSLTNQELTGGTITISNTGGLAPGWRISTPILNYPESVLIQPSGVEKQAVVNQKTNEIEIRDIVALSITFDHRIIDGVPILKFFTKLKEIIEDTDLLILE